MAISKVVSIEITDFTTKVCEVSYGKKVATVYNSLAFDNPENAIEDAYVIDKDRYVNELSAHLKDAKIRTKEAVFVLASNKILSREVIIPDMKEKLIPSYINGEKKDYFPMDISEHQITYCIADKNPDTKQIRLIVYAVPINLIKNYQVVAKELDMKIVKLDYTGNAEYHFLQSNYHTTGIDLYLEINEGNTMFTILDQGKYSLQRNMNFGSKSLVEHLMDEGYYGEITKDEAVAKLATEDLLFASYAEMMEYMPMDADDARLYELRRRLTEAVRPLIAGFTRVMEYYSTKNKETQIGDIYIGSCGAKIKGLDKLIMSEFENLSMKCLESLPNVKFSKDDFLMSNRSTEFLACIGAATPIVDFNMPDENSEKRNTTAFSLLMLIIGLAGSAVIVGIAVINYAVENSKQNSLNREIESLAEYEQLRTDRDTMSAQNNELQDFNKTTITENNTFNELLSDLEIKIPAQTTVTSVTSDAEALTLVVTVPDKQVAAKLLVQLDENERFTSVNVNSLQESETESANKMQSFTVVCNYPQPEPTPEPPSADGGEEDSATETDGGEVNE